MLREILFGMVATLCASAVAFDGELLLVTGASRNAVEASLRAQGRGDEADILVAAWNGRFEEFESLARTRLESVRDRTLAQFLSGFYARSGRDEEASRLRSRYRAWGERKLLRATSGAAYDMRGKRPIVFLHGYGGNAGTWSDFVRAFGECGYGGDDLLVFQYYDDPDNSSGSSRGLTTFGFDADTPIEKVAERVAERTRVWLRRRAGMPDGDVSRDAELPQPDWVCHSMGGLVFRCLYADHPDLVHRCVDLGTPHFGQNIDANWLIAGKQASQMKYGSMFLWALSEKWFFEGRICPDMLFVVGTAGSNSSVGGSVRWDGLVCAFSATLQDRASADYARRTYYVDRIHSSVLRTSLLGFDEPSLTELYEAHAANAGTADTVFRLAFGYLNDADSFASGSAPSQEDVLRDSLADAGEPDGGTGKADYVLSCVRSMGGLFVQVMGTETNEVGRLQQPVAYDDGTGWFNLPDDIVYELVPVNGGRSYGPDDDDVSWEHGPDDASYAAGVLFVYGNIQAGEYWACVDKPDLKATKAEAFVTGVTIAGGGVTVCRLRPYGCEPMSAFSFADDCGRDVRVTVPNAWLAEKGLVFSAEDLGGCVKAGGSRQANGCTAAESFWLGLDPADPSSVLSVGSFGVETEGRIRLGFSLGGRRVDETPGEAYRLVAQGAPTPVGPWTDLERDPSGAETYRASGNRFFRGVTRSAR